MKFDSQEDLEPNLGIGQPSPGLCRIDAVRRNDGRAAADADRLGRCLQPPGTGVTIATPEMASAWAKRNAEDWATESLAEARLAYRLPGTDRLIRSGTKLGEDYCRFALPIIQLRLAQSAVRVAFVLNRIFR